jgi:hypothetical protein
MQINSVSPGIDPFFPNQNNSIVQCAFGVLQTMGIGNF